MRIGRDRGRLYGDGRQSHQARQCWDDQSHVSLCRWGDNEAVCEGLY
jgi:hypothetical protein